MNDSAKPPPEPNLGRTESFGQSTLIDEVCKSFAAAWQAGQEPRIEDYLCKSPESREQLLAELLREEVFLRRAAGESVTTKEYVSRFPQHLETVARALGSTKQVDATGSTVRFANANQQGASTPRHPADRGSTVTHVCAVTAALDGPTEHGQSFGDYELLSEIARGGMGVVYRARQRKLNRIVALKMILSGQLAGEEQVRRFQAEAEAAAHLDHPGIVPVYEVGEHNGQPFFSMGFVEGPSLAKRLTDGPLPPREAAELVRQIAEAVHYAHYRGVIHRDLKPGNILLQKQEQGPAKDEGNRTPNERHKNAETPLRKAPSAVSPHLSFSSRPRITDFGLAKRVSDDAGLTATGQILGTPSYMAPEQARGQQDQVGPCSDVYALGAILYACLTGRPPFLGASIADTLRLVEVQEPVSLRQLNSAIPRDLETICLKCLRKEPLLRYASAISLVADLGRWLANKPIVARPVGYRERVWLWCKRRPTVAAMIAVTAVAMMGSSLVIAALQNAAADKQAKTERGAAIKQAQTAVEALFVAPAANVPSTLEQLRPLQQYAMPLLQAKLSDESADTVQRLHAAYGLAEFGKAPQAYLLDLIPTAPSAECRNLVAALQGVKSTALSGLKRRTFEATAPRRQFDAVRFLMPSEKQRLAAQSQSAQIARYAIVALQLGDPQLAQERLALRSDPIDRTTLIHAFADWHGDLAVVANVIAQYDNSALRSGLCVALGTIARGSVAQAELGEADRLIFGLNTKAPNGRALGAIPRVSIAQAEREAVTRVLVDLYAQAPDGGTHSAAGWALRQWKHALPPIATASSPPADRQWYVNDQGQTMLQLSPGTYAMGETVDERELLNVDEFRGHSKHEVRLTAFYISDCEVTSRQFMQFVDDSQYPDTEKPVRQKRYGSSEKLLGWKDEYYVQNHGYPESIDGPANAVNWFDAILYCNWLSIKEGIPPAYQRTGEKWKWKDTHDGDHECDAWRCDFAASGYRLPTEAEWEYACRASTTSSFSFGEDESLVAQYAWTDINSNNRASPARLKIPNGWGLFDMHGNLTEWCYDVFDFDLKAESEVIDDPTGPESTLESYRVTRGGRFDGKPRIARSAARHPWSQTMRTVVGFRLVRTCP